MSDERELHMVPCPVEPVSSYWYAVRDLHASLAAAVEQLDEARRYARLANSAKPNDPPPIMWFDFDGTREKLCVAQSKLPVLPETYARIDGGCTPASCDTTRPND